MRTEMTVVSLSSLPNALQSFRRKQFTWLTSVLGGSEYRRPLPNTVVPNGRASTTFA